MDQALKILIADDEEAIRHAFKNLLEDYNYEVLEAVNGIECLEIFEKESPDLVLLDVRMPEMDGLKVLEKLTKEFPETPVIIVSGAGVISDVVDALHFGAWDYHLKPIKDLELLVDSIQKALDRSRFYKENTRYRKHLEEEVKEKTRKHEAANRELRSEIAAREKTEKELLKLNERMKDIVKSFREIDSVVSLEKASKVILKEFAENMNAKGGSFFLKHRDAFILQSTMDNLHVPPSIPLKMKRNSVFNKSVLTKSPVLISDIASETEIDTSGWNGYTDGSVLIFPLLDREDDIMGLISLHNKEYPPFNHQDLDVGTVFASYCGEKIQVLKAVDALRRNEEKYRFIAENTNDVIWTANKDLDYTYVSPAIHRMAGFKPHEIIGKNINDSLTEDSFNKFLKTLYEEMARDDDREQYLTLELEKKRKDGSLIWIEEQITILKQDENADELVGILGVTRDITKKKELELKLRQAQKMESIGTLAGGIAHDFNNILAGILGNTELLKIKIPEDEFFDKKLNNILSAVTRAKDLVSQILEFSRQMDSKRQDVDTRIILKEISKMLRSMLPATIRIQCHVPSDPLYINADVNQIHQIIMNLCTNAHHAMKKNGGTLTLSLSGHKEEDNKWIEMKVADTGHGIPESIIDRVFDPYFTTKELGVGTGLGLSVVHGIVESHSGKISLESSDKGTEFTMTFPMVDKTRKVVEEKINIVESGNEKILFVDDEISIVEVCKDMLEHLGYNVLTTTSSIEALEIFEKEHNSIDLVITDMTMPEMTGDLLASRIKDIKPDIPVIMCTGYSEDITEENSKESAVNELLVKPIKIADLSKAIHNFL